LIDLERCAASLTLSEPGRLRGTGLVHGCRGGRFPLVRHYEGWAAEVAERPNESSQVKNQDGCCDDREPPRKPQRGTPDRQD
jgi:hypothetical protein